MYTSSFLCTKPRLSQARALLFPKVFVPLGIKKNLIMTKIHFRSYIHNQMQWIDKDIVKCPQIVSADNLSNTKKEERITLHLLMEFAREELSLIKYKTNRCYAKQLRL